MHSPESKYHISNLAKLDYSNKSLSEFPLVVITNNSHSLEHLDLSNNQIEHIPVSSMAFFPHLKV